MGFDNFILMKSSDTGLKKTILLLLNEVKVPQTVSDIMSVVSANKTSIYRSINTLVSKGLVNELEFGDRTKRYEISNLGHHHHLICKICGVVNEVKTNDDFSKSEKKLATKTGFTSIVHKLEFFGICPNCRK